ncbi:MULTISPECIES: hypothetical protein [Aeromonas]|uniref:Uncharacterized protein n=1 Tax=Aeromonas veronii TaxID=654 RepID=A0A4S5CJY9_AERVE|nr:MULTISPECIES: hypothetical protein [Aeromonas]THJ44923.1 hypothetical protein E8Q35_12085 [Aeromonas veronii]
MTTTSKKNLSELNDSLAQKLQSFEKRHVDSLVPKGSIIWLRDGVFNTDGDIHHLVVKEDTRCNHAIALDGSICFTTSKVIKEAVKISLQSAMKFLELPEQLDYLARIEKDVTSSDLSIITVPANQLAWRAISNGKSELSAILDDKNPVDLHLMTVSPLGQDLIALVGFGKPGKAALKSIQAKLQSHELTTSSKTSASMTH